MSEGLIASLALDWLMHWTIWAGQEGGNQWEAQHLQMMVVIHQKGRQLRCSETHQKVSLLMEMKVLVLNHPVDLNPEAWARGAIISVVTCF